MPSSEEAGGPPGIVLTSEEVPSIPPDQREWSRIPRSPLLRSTEVDHHNDLLPLVPRDRGRAGLRRDRRGSGKRTEVHRRPSSEEGDTATRSLRAIRGSLSAEVSACDRGRLQDPGPHRRRSDSRCSHRNSRFPCGWDSRSHPNPGRRSGLREATEVAVYRRSSTSSGERAGGGGTRGGRRCQRPP